MGKEGDPLPQLFFIALATTCYYIFLFLYMSLSGEYKLHSALSLLVIFTVASLMSKVVLGPQFLRSVF